jgi:hypothetical protein
VDDDFSGAEEIDEGEVQVSWLVDVCPVEVKPKWILSEWMESRVTEISRRE